MQLKRKKVSLKEEQRIITNMITSTEFLKQTKHIIRSYLLKSSYAKAVAGWCLEYFENTGAAPGRDIKDVYIQKRKSLEDEEEVELVSEFLQNLSSEWESSQINNTGYEVKKAIKYIKLRRLELLRDQLTTAITEGQEEEGEECIANFEKIEDMSSTDGVDLLNDAKAVEDAFNETEEVLFKLAGDLGKAVGNLCRGDFLAILGGPKSGKSFFSADIGQRAARLGFKVVILNFEMTKYQETRRSWQSLLGLPKVAATITMPSFEEDEDGNGYHIVYRQEKRVGVKEVNIRKRQAYYRKYFQGGNIRMETFISGQSTFEEAVTRLANLEYYEGFIPDVVIWDYPDIMNLGGKGQSQHRHNLDMLWQKIRGYGVDKNVLTIAPSQVNSSAWEKDIKGSDADENKKKANHVTKMIALNGTEEERDQGIVRVQVLYQREGKKVLGQVCVLHCLDIGRFYMDSKFRKDVIMDDE